jgi:EPS-associated MarR family transcriptional regulator
MVASVQPMNTSSSITATELNISVRTLQMLQEQPAISQRAMAEHLGVSLGKAHYCLQALLAKGLIKAKNFKNSQNKLAYAYVLTPAGIKARADLTAEFLQVKIREYEQLRVEIEQLKIQTDRLQEPAFKS